MHRKIAEIKEEEDRVLINNKDGSEEISIVAEELTSFSDLVGKFAENDKIYIITLNKKEYIKILISDWNKITKYKGLTLMFVYNGLQLFKVDFFWLHKYRPAWFFRLWVI